MCVCQRSGSVGKEELLRLTFDLTVVTFLQMISTGRQKEVHYNYTRRSRYTFHRDGERRGQGIGEARKEERGRE